MSCCSGHKSIRIVGPDAGSWSQKVPWPVGSMFVKPTARERRAGVVVSLFEIPVLNDRQDHDRLIDHLPRSANLFCRARRFNGD